jgi:hypothetical protein
MSQNCANYNRILSIASTKVENNRGGGYERIIGDHCVKINGNTKHFLFSNSSVAKSGINYFTYDGGEERMNNHASELNAQQSATVNRRVGPKILHPILKDIFHEQKEINIYVKDLNNVSELINTNNENANVKNIIARINSRNEGIEVAGVTPDNVQGNTIIRFKLKGKSNSTDIKTTDRRVEPFCYPLLFPYGENGWSVDMTIKVPFMKYLASRILMPEKNLFMTSKTGRVLNVNRFQMLARLMQYYIVESVSRGIDYRLEWYRNNKSTIFGEISKNLNLNNDEFIDEDEDITDMNNDQNKERDVMNNSNATYLAESFFGSPRHLKSLAINALAIVSELGPPTFFITVTTDTRWNEIQEVLLEGQTAFDRPDVVCQIFKARLQALLHNLKKGKYFNNGKVQYIMYVIEYQHRGLPHAHIVVRLDNHPTDEQSDVMKLRYISQHIQARYPQQILNCTQTETDIYKTYFDLIESKMIHKCSTQAPNGCKKDTNSRCRHGFSEHVQNISDTFDERGYPVYFRPNEDDLMVVAHNKKLLLDWNGHCNVEYCGKTYAVLYLYNYLFKGKHFSFIFVMYSFNYY